MERFHTINLDAFDDLLQATSKLVKDSPFAKDKTSGFGSIYCDSTDSRGSERISFFSPDSYSTRQFILSKHLISGYLPFRNMEGIFEDNSLLACMLLILE